MLHYDQFQEVYAMNLNQKRRINPPAKEIGDLKDFVNRIKACGNKCNMAMSRQKKLDKMAVRLASEKPNQNLTSRLKAPGRYIFQAEDLVDWT